MLLKDLSALASPLNDQQISQLQQAISELTPTQMAWASGYFWGLSQQQGEPSSLTSSASNKVSTQLTIIYASQTGNAKSLAHQIAEQASTLNIAARVVDAADYKGKQLAKETHVLIVASTNGEGEAPDNAIELHEFLQSKKAPKLPNLKYGVIALGDSSYEFFCQTGKDFDHYLSKLGASAFLERVDCDVDYEDAANAFIEKAFQRLEDDFKSQAGESAPLVASHRSTASKYSKQNPYAAQLLTNQKITGRDSDKDVRHIEIDLEGSGLTYQPGDSLGIWYQNASSLVKEILALVGLSGVESVNVDGESVSIHQALIDHYEITAANPQFVEKYAQLSNSKKLKALVDDKSALRQYANTTQIIDVIKEEKTDLTAEQLIDALRKLTPRLYSIASSQSEVEDEVHLTLGVVSYRVDDEVRYGGASGFLAHRLEEGEIVKVFVEHNNQFKLPQDDNANLIMIGPGTGIAPFRSFIQEREVRDASGENWLFFGDRTFTQDFLYQTEWQKYLKDGVLNRLDVAFSRDQAEKVYVQHKLLEHAQTLWQWLESGAYIYVCGDAEHMAKDVHQTFVEIVQTQGSLSQEEAQEYMNELRRNKRYQKDVY